MKRPGVEGSGLRAITYFFETYVGFRFQILNLAFFFQLQRGVRWLNSLNVAFSPRCLMFAFLVSPSVIRALSIS